MRNLKAINFSSKDLKKEDKGQRNDVIKESFEEKLMRSPLYKAASKKYVNYRDYKGMTALHYAA